MHIVRYTIYLITFFSSFLSFSFDVVANTTELEKQEKALTIIADFADRFCKEIPMEGSGENLELSGKAKVELNKLIKKIVDLGIEGAAKYETTQWKGALQEDLTELLKTTFDCRMAVWEDLKDKLITSPVESQIEPKTTFSFTVNPPKAKPGEEVTLYFNDYIGHLFKVYFSGRLLPKKISADGRQVVITVPGGTPSGEYTIEVEYDTGRYRSNNTLSVFDPLDNFSFSINPKNVKTGQDVELYLNDPIGKRFDVFIYGNYGRVNRRLFKKQVLKEGRIVVLTIPEDIVDGTYSLNMRFGNRTFYSDDQVYVDNPKYHRAPPAR